MLRYLAGVTGHTRRSAAVSQTSRSISAKREVSFVPTVSEPIELLRLAFSTAALRQMAWVFGGK